MWRYDDERITSYVITVTLVETTIARELLASLGRDAQADLVLLPIVP